MKNSFLSLLILVSTSAFAQQTVTEQFQKITNQQQADQFIAANPNLKPTIFKVSSQHDTSVLTKRLLRQNKGDIFSVGYVTYKVLDATEKVNYRANYIFLDGASLTPTQIDSLKKLIIQKHNAGATFEQLSDQYTMDGNTTHGDTGWFFGEEMMPREFQEAVKNHQKNEIFSVDVSDKQWHYLVKKTYDDDDKKEMTILRANGR
jgi:parvulin-like peptidyl-prolyl isomerase